MCLPFLKFSDLLPQTYFFYLALSYCMVCVSVQEDNPRASDTKSHNNLFITSGRSRGGSGGSLEPPSSPPIFKYPIKMK